MKTKGDTLFEKCIMNMKIEVYLYTLYNLSNSDVELETLRQILNEDATASQDPDHKRNCKVLLKMFLPKDEYSHEVAFEGSRIIMKSNHAKCFVLTSSKNQSFCRNTTAWRRLKNSIQITDFVCKAFTKEDEKNNRAIVTTICENINNA